MSEEIIPEENEEIDFDDITDSYLLLVDTIANLLGCDADTAAEAVALVWTFIVPDEETFE